MSQLLTKRIPRALGKWVFQLNQKNKDKNEPSDAGSGGKERSEKHEEANKRDAVTKDEVKSTKFELPFWDRNGKERLLAINNPFRGTLVIGGAGSGKTATIANPLLYQAVTKGFAGIVYDYKFPELASVAKMAYEKEGSKLAKQYVISFEHPHLSHKVNPLHPRYIQTVSQAEECAKVILYNLNPESISKPDFWNRSAIALLQAAIWFFREEFPDQCNLPYVVSFLQSDTTRMLETLRTNAVCARLISSILTAHDRRALTQLAAIVGSLQLALNSINTPEATAILSGDEVDLDLNNPQDPKLLVIGSSPQMKEALSPLISLICSVALKKMNAPGKCPSLVLLDEAPTLYIPGLEEVPATGRSRKIAVVYLAQDFSQITDRYGKEKKDALVANLMNQFYGRVSHFETAEYVSKVFGNEERTVKSTTLSHGNGLNREDQMTSHFQLKAQAILPSRQVLELNQGCFASIVPETDKDTAQVMLRQYAPMVIPGKPFSEFAPVGKSPLHLTSEILDHSEVEKVAEFINLNVLAEAAPKVQRTGTKRAPKQTRLKF